MQTNHPTTDPGRDAFNIGPPLKAWCLPTKEARFFALSGYCSPEYVAVESQGIDLLHWDLVFAYPESDKRGVVNQGERLHLLRWVLIPSRDLQQIEPAGINGRVLRLPTREEANGGAQ